MILNKMFGYYKYIFTTKQIIRSVIIFAVLCSILLTIACNNTETKTNTTTPATDSSSTKSSTDIDKALSPDIDKALSADIDKSLIENNFEHVITLSETATSFDITAGNSNEIYAALKEEYDLFVLHSTDGGLSFDSPIKSNNNALITGLVSDRPAIAASDNGSVAVTWTSGKDFARIWYSLSQDYGKTFDRSFVLSYRDPKPLTGFSEISFDNNKNPVASWVQEGGIRVSQSFDGGETFSIESGVDSEVSACTKSSIASAENDHILVAYRDRELLDNKPIRPIKLGVSTDFGQVFGTRQFVSNNHWDIETCPNSFPSIQSYKDNVYITWMDGGVQDNPSLTNIWFAKATLNSQYFSNIQLNQITLQHSHPSITVSSNGDLHIIWASRESDKAVIKYVSSKDGITFSNPTNIVSSNDGSNRRTPSHPTIISDKADNIYVAWSDALGTHIGQLKKQVTP